MPVWSNSRLSSFEKCPLQYRYRYIDRIKRDTQGIEAFMGTRVHDALEHLYREVGKGRTPPVDEVVGVYRDRWAREYDPGRITIVRREKHAEDYRATGEKCLRDFHAAYAPFDDGETIGLETKVQFALDPQGRYQVMGYIDRIVRPEPGVYEVHDFKTSASRPSDADLRRDRQLTLYLMAVRDRYRDAREVRLVWHYLAQGERRTSPRTEADVETHRREAIRLIDTIEAARDYPARESALCRWCEYRDICPTQQGALVQERAALEAGNRGTGGATPAARPAGEPAQGSLFSAPPAPPAPRPPRGE